MLGKNQLHILLSCDADLWTVGQDLQTFLYLVVTGGYKLLLADYFHEADTAGRNFVDIF